MDFAALKKKALEIKDKGVEFGKKTIEETAKKVGESNLVLKNQEDLNKLIEKSKNTSFETESGELKNYVKRSYLIIGDSNKDFFKKMLISLPVFLAKTFSQDIYFKMSDLNNKEVSLEDYDIFEYPCLLVFENKELLKIIYGEENLNKLVKSLSLDINKSVDEL